MFSKRNRFSLKTPPFIEREADNVTLKGLSIDLWSYIQKELEPFQLSFNFYESNDGLIGMYDYETSTWNGVIGGLQRNQVKINILIEPNSNTNLF